MLKACRREAAPYTPIWLMRQAGRYMPEYRRVRERHGFLEMCKRPELAAEVTVTAVERLKVDAAIIFADILLPLIPMEVGLHFEKGDGPVIDRPVRTEADLERIPAVDVASLGFVGDAIKLVNRAIGATTPLIGFAGAPFTLASYLIEGGSSRQYQATKTFMYMQPETWHRLMEMLARITADYLNMQIAAGADIVQIFDSWVGTHNGAPVDRKACHSFCPLFRRLVCWRPDHDRRCGRGVIFYVRLALDDHHEVLLFRFRIGDNELWRAAAPSAGLARGDERASNALYRALLFLDANVIGLLVVSEFSQLIAYQVLGYPFICHFRAAPRQHG